MPTEFETPLDFVTNTGPAATALALAGSTNTQASGGQTVRLEKRK